MSFLRIMISFIHWESLTIWQTSGNICQKNVLEKYKDDLVYVKSTETGKKYPIGIKLEKNAWVKETGWYPDTCVVGLADGLKNKDLAVKFIEEKILEE